MPPTIGQITKTPDLNKTRIQKDITQNLNFSSTYEDSNDWMKKQLLSHENAEKVIKKVDKMRENYVKTYAETSRYDTRNYDLVISMAGQGIQKTKS